MSLDSLQVWCSPLTGRIYAGYPKKATKKIDVTKQVINAVMQHMDVTKEEYECQAGELIFKPKGSNSTEIPNEVEAEG